MENKTTKILITLNVNGSDVELEVDPRTLLADVLREELNLKALHLGCEQGVCGACAVMINGEPAASCLTLAVEAQENKIETVEYLSRKTGELGPLEKSFIKHGAFQCGFCTPGVQVVGHYLVEKGLNKDRETVRNHLSGNVCRCTGYESIIDAIVAVDSAVGVA